MSTIIIAIIVGILAAASSTPLGGFVAGALTWLLMRSREQDQQIAALKRTVEDLQGRSVDQVALPIRPATSVVPPGIAAPVRTGSREDVWWTPVPAAAATGTAAPVEAPAGPVAAELDVLPGPEMSVLPEPSAPGIAGEVMPPPGLPAAMLAPPEPGREDLLAPIKRWLLGGNTIVKAGVGILFIGLAFLARYASDYVAVELRLAGIGGVAVALLGLGWRLRTRRPGYAQVLQGGAVAILYLTLFVAFRFYGVLTALPVFAMMVAVAALAAALAVLQDARSLAIIGALGGFATPLLVSSGSGNHIALFSYYMVLDLGIAAVAWYRTWPALNLIGFVGTFLVGSAWGILKYQSEHFASSEGFLVAYFLLFIAILLLPARRLGGGSGGVAWLNGSLLFGLPTITFALQYGLVRHTEYGTALSALALAGFYVLLAAWMRARPRWAATFEAILTIGTVFLTLVVPFALDARSTAGAWAFEGVGLVWLGFRQRRPVSRLLGYALLLLACGPLMLAYDRFQAPEHVLNGYLFAALMLAAGSLAAAYFVQRFTAAAPKQEPALDREPTAEPLLIAWATLWAVVAAGVQIDVFVAREHTLAAWLMALSAIALVYTALTAGLRWRSVAAPVLAHAPALAICVVISADTLASPAQGGGAWAWPLALFTHLLVLWRAAPNWSAEGRTAAHVLGVLVLAALGGLQGRAITADWGDPESAWAWLGWLAVPAALSLWISLPAAARRWPVRAAPSAYQTIAGAVLAGGLMLWSLAANVRSDGAARPLPHVPLVNPLDLGIGGALAAAWLWTRSDGARLVLGGARPWLLAGACFLWVNAIMVRGFHHYGGLPFSDELLESLAVQTGLTLLWAASALIVMWLSARRAARVPWLAGAALLGVVVFKLLLVDLSAADTVTRIVSFIGVGLLMLVIGFVAPLPATEEPHAKE